MMMMIIIIIIIICLFKSTVSLENQFRNGREKQIIFHSFII